jgi:predicted dehydrogenase
MVQVGSQGRSMPHIIEAVRLLREGAIGKVYMAKGLCYKRRKSIGRTPDEPVPAGVNWDLFLGPAQMKPYSKNKFAYNWHWFWDTGNGDIGNQGVHEMDMARWGLGKPGLPNWVFSSGGKFIYEDDQETPNTQLATFGYGDSQLSFEVRGILTGEECAVDRGGTNVVGDYFLGADGYLSVAFGGCKVFKGEKNELASEHKPEPGRENRHFANFLQAVRSGNYKDLNADVEVGVMSACLCHLANISYRLGRKLAFNPDTWTFVGDSEANRMLTREYRKPYVVPDRV